MTDWKPGDRFTIEYEVARAYASGTIRTTDGDEFYDRLHRAVRLPPKARPVRKGDEVKPESAPVPVTFLATWNNQVIIWRNGYGCDVYGKEYVAHADGAPISWEDSE